MSYGRLHVDSMSNTKIPPPDLLRLGTISAFDLEEPQTDNQEAVPGLSTGIPKLDRLTSGLKAGDLVALVVPPPVDGTKIAMDIARHVAIGENRSVAVFSAGAAKEDLASHILCSEAAVDAKKMDNGNGEREDFERLVSAQRTIERARFFIDDSDRITIDQIREGCQRLQREHGLDLVIINSCDADDASRMSALSGIARGLALSIVAVCAPSAEVDSRDGIGVFLAREK